MYYFYSLIFKYSRPCFGITSRCKYNWNFIFNNRIEKNKGNGIYGYTFDTVRCDGKVKRNEITGNNKNGILLSGKNNRMRIEAN